MKSEPGNCVVWWPTSPEQVYKFDKLSLLKKRFDNFGRGKSVYHLQVQENAYLLNLTEETALLRTRSTTPETDIDLIRGWAATFKGQTITRFRIESHE